MAVNKKKEKTPAKKNFNSSIQSFNFSTKNFNKPEVFTEQTLDYVKFGKDNRLPYEFLNYYTNSSMNRAIIQKKSQMFKGKEITFESTDEKQDNKTQNFMNSVNPQEDMKQLLGKIGLDIFIFGGSYLQIIWSKNGKNIVEIYHMPFASMRSGKANENGFIETFYFNPSSQKDKEYRSYTDVRDLIKFNAFNTNKNKIQPQILFIQKEEPTNIYYPFPDYISSLVDLDTDVEISNYLNSSLYNGFNPGMMVIFKGVEPTPEEKDEFMKGINTKYKGSDNANRVIVFYSDGENAPEIKQLEVSEIGDQFQALSKSTTENIVSGHQIPRALASIAQPGSLGNSKEILQAMQIFTANYIQPHQELVLNYMNKIMSINKLNDIEIINPNINIALFSITELKLVLSINEIREYLGYDEIEDVVVIVDEKVEDVEVVQDTEVIKNNDSEDGIK